MNEFFRRIRYLLNRRRYDREMASDMEAHREMAALNGSDGNDAPPFGNTLRLREEAREAWGWTWIDRLSQDLRYAFRMLRKTPGFTLGAVLMLALGIGVNVAAFGFFNLMILKPLPVRDPATLLRFKRHGLQSYASNLPYPEMSFFRQYSKTLSAVLAVYDDKLSAEGEAKPLSAQFVTADYFRELGAGAKLGRLFDPVADEAISADPVVVLSEGFWQRHFGADPSVVGKTIRLNEKSATVIGVASHEFSGLNLETPDLWAPIARQPYFVTGSKLFTDFSVESMGVRTFGRLQNGATPRLAEEELRSLAAQLRREHPEGIWENERLPSVPAGYATNNAGSHHGTGAEASNELYPVVGLVGALVLLIFAVACGNLGSLLLARGVAREREISIRIAVGAGRGRLVRQLFTESLLLALLGAVAGLGLGYVVLRGLMALTGTPVWLNPAPDWRVVTFAVGIGFAAAMLFGLTPALHIARQKHRATTLRQFMVAAQVAASCVLLIVAGLLVRALHRATSSDPGFEYRQVVSIDPALGAHGYTPARARTYLDALQGRLKGLPGVESVALASTPPLGNKKITMGMQIDGHNVDIHLYAIDPSFLQTMRIPILRGRNLTWGDTRAVVIGQSFARVQWPGEDPIGKTVPMADTKFTVVGVAGSARMVALQDSDGVEIYTLASPSDLSSMVALVKLTGPPEGAVSFLASIAKSIDPKVFPELQLLKVSFSQRLQGAEYSALSVSLLGLLALLLACLGIVGVVAFAVSQRTKEIGIRMALGARPANVLGLILHQFSRPVAAGLLAGLGGAAALSQFLRGHLYGISNLDPVAYLAALGLFGVTAALAALLPARRALRLNPLRALRYE